MPIEANMHKLKVIFNKGTDDEAVEEFIVVSVVETHTQDNIIIEVSAEGLAFHELGKIGYKISLSSDDFNEASYQWFTQGMVGEEPINNINYWNDLVFKDEDGNWKYDWEYEICMDWSSYSQGANRESDVIYEDEYVSSWQFNYVTAENSDIYNDYPVYNSSREYDVGDRCKYNSKFYICIAATTGPWNSERWQQDETRFVPAQIEGFDEKLRYVDAEESNIYNITQDIAKIFGVFCRYEYEYDEDYHTVGKKVIYYNNYLQEIHTKDGVITTHLDLTYPYSTSEIKRTIDSTDIVTKMYVRTVDSNATDTNIISIMDVDANKSREDYILNFDYLHEIGTISDGQYEIIAPYEAEMRRINDKLSVIEKQIMVLMNELIEVQAKITISQNALQLDLEQIDNAQAEENALTGGTGYIPITAVNAKPFCIKYDKKGNKGYYIDISLEGLDPNTLKVYLEKDNTQQSVSKEITEYRCAYENNNLVRLEQIIIRENNEVVTSAGTRIYITGMYDPHLYWENVERVWAAREAYDRAELEKAKAREETIKWYLYGKRADFSITELTQVYDEHEHDGDSYVVARVGERTDPHPTTVGNSRIWGLNTEPENDIMSDLLGYTPDLLWTQERLLKEKKRLINYFEQLMGPALREGYWQPEDYSDYGDKYIDSFTIGNDNTNKILPSQSDLVSFSWDGDKLFSDEEEIIYQSSVAGTYEQYIVVDLSDYLSVIAANMDSEDLAFVYYDYAAVTQLEEMLATQYGYNYNSLTPAQINTIVYGDFTDPNNPKPGVLTLKDHNDITRTFMIGSQCEFGFIKDTSDNKEYIPVLILTDAQQLSANEINFIINPLRTAYKPFIGHYSTTVNETATEVTENITPIITNIEFITDASFPIGTLIPAQQKDDFSLKRVYPRIFIHSLKLKTSDDELLVNLNSNALNNYEDYYVLVDERGDTEETYRAGYAITLKADKIFYYGTQTLNIDLSFVLSNADVAIYLDALKISKENAYPKVSYDVQLCALDYNLLRTAYNKLNYIVHINDRDLQLRDVYGYISSITIPLSKIWETEVEVKNYETKFEDLFSTIVAQTESMQKNEAMIYNLTDFITPSGVINKDVLQNSVAQSRLSYSFNQGSLTIDEANGIWGTSDDGVVAFRGGGIFTATTKDAEGNWNWNTGILPSGINANLITTGQLDTNKIRVFAGDKVQFQLNGEGLFAYKSFFETGDDKDKLDPSQYAVFNSEGLFLIAKNGSKLTDYQLDSNGAITGIQEASDALTTDVTRVEISWQGLVLRNSGNKPVFYADTLGNLNLEGCITATSGSIGGWRIDGHRLISEAIWSSGVGAETVVHPYVILNGHPAPGEAFLQMIDEQGHGLIFNQAGLTFTGTLENVAFIGEKGITCDQVYATGANGSCSIDDSASVSISVADKDKTILNIQYGRNKDTIGYIKTEIRQKTENTYVPYIVLSNREFSSSFTLYDTILNGRQYTTASTIALSSIAIGGGNIIITAPDGINFNNEATIQYENGILYLQPANGDRVKFVTELAPSNS